jgi:hypothetical protein
VTRQTQGLRTRSQARLQRVASAVGAARQGDKVLDGQPNADVRRRTDGVKFGLAD